MANIAHVRTFDGTDDKIELDPSQLVATPGAFTVAAIFRRPSGSFPDNRAFLSLDGGTGSEWAMEIQSTLFLNMYDEVAIGDGGGFSITTDAWHLGAWTKTAGTSAFREHLYEYDLDSWSHANRASQVAMGTPSGTPDLWIGSYTGVTEFFPGDLACIGVWYGTAVSDGNLETMDSDLAAWEDLNPTALWLLNQTSTSDPVNDRIGGCHEIAITGTSVTEVSDLPFDVGGDSGLAWIRA